MNNLMTHVVAGYPSVNACLDLLVGMDTLGVQDIEIQIPFSDPSADGPTIMKANDIALGLGMTIETSFQLVADARARGVTARLHIMTYINKLFYVGIKKFCERAAQRGVSGFVIPDLTLGSLEYKEFIDSSKSLGLAFLPVLSPGMDEDRLIQLTMDADEMVYLTSTHGITGNSLRLDKNLSQAVDSIRAKRPDIKIALGFGIRSADDVRRALELADCAVVGSAIIDAIMSSDNSIEAGISLVQSLVRDKVNL